MVDKTITLDLTSEGIRQTAEVTQGDTGRVLKCNIIGLNLTGVTARFIAVKQSKKIIYNNCEISENAVIIKLTEQALAETGITECQIELSKDEEIVQSFVFNLDVKKSLLKSATVSENELGVLDDIQKDIENLKQTKADKNQYGAPLSAKTAAEMTDTSKQVTSTETGTFIRMEHGKHRESSRLHRLQMEAFQVKKLQMEQ